MAVNNLGSVPASTTIYLFWTSHDGATGANEALTGLAATDIEIYKNGGTTQRASDAGYTLLDTDGIDFDGMTGVNGVSIDLSDNTDSGFYAVGSSYDVFINAVTIDAQTVIIHLASFRIVAAEAITGKPKVDVDGWLGTAAATPTTAGVPEVDLTHVAGSAVSTSSAQLGVNVVNAAGTAWGSGAITAASIASDAITAAKLAADVATEINTAVLAVLGALDDTAADGDPTTTDTALAYLKQLINILIGSAGVVTFPSSATPGNAVSLAEVLRQVYDEVAGLNGGALLDAAGIRTAVGLASANLDTQLDALPTTAEVNAEVDTALADYDAPTRAELTSDINSVLAVLNGLVLARGTIGASGNDTTHLHLDGLTFGNDELNSLLLVVYDVSESEYHSRWIEDWVLATELATVATLPFTPQDSTDTYWLLSARADVTGGSGLDAAGVRAAIGLASANLDTQLDALPTAAENADAVWDEAATGHTDAGKAGEQLWTDVDAILVDTSTTLQGELDGIQTDTEDIQSRLPAALTSNGNMKSSLLEIIGTALSEGAAGRIAAAFQTMFNVASSVFTTASVNQTGDAYARIGAPAGASVSADIADVEGKVDDLESRLGTPSDLGSGATVAANLADIEGQTDDIGAAGAGLTALATAASLTTVEGKIDALNNLSAAQVNAEVDTALADYDPPTKTEMDTAQAAIIDGILDGIRIRKNTEFAAFPFKMVDETDHVTAETGLTVTATRSIDGAAFAACANSAAEIASGWYKITLAAADLNGDVIILRFTATGADDREIVVFTQPTD